MSQQNLNHQPEAQNETRTVKVVCDAADVEEVVERLSSSSTCVWNVENGTETKTVIIRGDPEQVRSSAIRLLLGIGAGAELWKSNYEEQFEYDEVSNYESLKPTVKRKNTEDPELSEIRRMLRWRNIEATAVAIGLAKPAVSSQVLNSWIRGSTWLQEAYATRVKHWMKCQTNAKFRKMQRTALPDTLNQHLLAMIRLDAPSAVIHLVFDIGLKHHGYASLPKKSKKFYKYLKNATAKLREAEDDEETNADDSEKSDTTQKSTSSARSTMPTPADATGPAPVACASTSPPDPPSDRDSSDEDRSDSTQVSSSSRSSSSSSTTRSSTSSSTSTRSRSTNSEKCAGQTQDPSPRDGSISPLASIRSSVDSEMDRDTILKCTGHRQGALPIVQNSLSSAGQTQDPSPRDGCTSPLNPIHTSIDLDYDMEAHDASVQFDDDVEQGFRVDQHSPGNRDGCVHDFCNSTILSVVNETETMCPRSTPILRTRRSSAGSELPKKESSDALSQPLHVSCTESESLVPVGAKSSRRVVAKQDQRYELPDTYPDSDLVTEDHHHSGRVASRPEELTPVSIKSRHVVLQMEANTDLAAKHAFLAERFAVASKVHSDKLSAHELNVKRLKKRVWDWFSQLVTLIFGVFEEYSRTSHEYHLAKADMERAREEMQEADRQLGKNK